MLREEDILIALRRIAHASDLYSRRLMAGTGLTGPQLLVLRLLHGWGPLPLGQLAREMKLSQGPLSSLLDRLEARGLVLRMRSTRDRRSVLARLTADGEQAVASAPGLLQPDFARALNALPDWEQTQLLSGLQRIASLMESGAVPAVPTAEPDAGSQPLAI